jgi:hypothetical protein
MTGPVWTLLRWVFLVAVVIGAWWSWHEAGDEVVWALKQVRPVSLAVAAVLITCGLLLTGLAWQIALSSFGVVGVAREVIPPFFVAQLGKYIPGSVWSFAAQGALGARQGMPARVPAAAAVLFLGLHVATGLTLVGTLGWWTSLPSWLIALCLGTGMIGLLPPVYRILGSRLSGLPCRWSLTRSLRGALVMSPVWFSYGLAVVVLAPGADASVALTLGCAFAVAHAAGIATPVAPAGLGARDGVLVLLIAPVLGATPAGVVALMARLLHTMADFLLAGASWLAMRAFGAPQSSGAVGLDD